MSMPIIPASPTVATPTPEPEAPETQKPQPASPAATPEPPEEKPAAGPTPPAPEAENVDALPEWAQKIIKDTRKEAQGLRQTREAQIAQAKQQAQTEVAQSIGKALGLVPNNEPVDPQTLVAQAQTEREQAAARAKTADIRLAVYQAAPSKNIADLLLDSRTFDAEVQQLDPTAADFPAQVAQAVQTAVTQNPTRYATAPAAAPANTGGSPVSGAPAGGGESVEDFRKKYRESRGVGF